jgi:hypothetical protein
VLTNVPVALADESSVNVDISLPETGSQISRITHLPHLHGLLRVREMRKFGMIIGCTRQMIYVRMRLNSTDHFDVPGALNGHGTGLIVDTDASTATADKKTRLEQSLRSAAHAFGLKQDKQGSLRSAPAQ